MNVRLHVTTSASSAVRQGVVAKRGEHDQMEAGWREVLLVCQRQQTAAKALLVVRAQDEASLWKPAVVLVELRLVLWSLVVVDQQQRGLFLLLQPSPPF